MKPTYKEYRRLVILTYIIQALCILGVVLSLANVLANI